MAALQAVCEVAQHTIMSRTSLWVQEKFEELFAKYDKENRGGVTFREILQLWWHNRDVSCTLPSLLDTIMQMHVS